MNTMFSCARKIEQQTESLPFTHHPKYLKCYMSALLDLGSSNYTRLWPLLKSPYQLSCEILFVGWTRLRYCQSSIYLLIEIRLSL